MRTIFVIFDSLNRKSLGCYGSADGLTPNMDRFAQRSVVFDKHYVGSLPCMPARRDMHTGRLNFMHRAWGPLEPFDNSFVRMLGQAGTYTRLITDHGHYFEDGGAGYVTAYESWDFIRGQEGDPWVARVTPPLAELRAQYGTAHYPFDRMETGPFTKARMDMPGWIRTQNTLNRSAMREEADFPVTRCYESALDFIDANHDAEDWFLQIEAFDPHEPFHAPDRYRDAASGSGTDVLDWPHYRRVTESAEEIAEIRGHYAALVRACDAQFGRLMDAMDRHDMWRDTCVVLTTDHGFLLGEHEWWAKNRMPYYEEISHIPLVVWHPDQADAPGRRRAVTQTPDLMPTFLDLHGVDTPPEATGQSLLPLLEQDRAEPRSVIFGMFAGPVGVTDGRYAYYLYPDRLDGSGFNEYTLAPQRMMGPFEVEELQDISLHGPFDFTKGISLLKLPSLPTAKRPPNDQKGGLADAKTVLFDLETDPEQAVPLDAPGIEARLKAEIARHLRRHDAPPELFERFPLGEAALTAEAAR